MSNHHSYLPSFYHKVTFLSNCLATINSRNNKILHNTKTTICDGQIMNQSLKSSWWASTFLLISTIQQPKTCADSRPLHVRVTAACEQHTQWSATSMWPCNVSSQPLCTSHSNQKRDATQYPPRLRLMNWLSVAGYSKNTLKNTSRHKIQLHANYIHVICILKQK